MSARRSVMIVGAGGHARVVASILALDPGVVIAGVADRSTASMGETVGPSRIVTTMDDSDEWRRMGARAVALALGDNRERAAAFERLTASGWEIVSAIHPTATIEAGVTLGRGCVICARSVLCAEARLGENVLVNTGAIVDHEGRVASHAHVGPGVVLAGRVSIGDLTFVGAGSTVRDGVTIGARCVVGCGSVVVDDLPDAVVAYGVPARVRRPIG